MGKFSSVIDMPGEVLKSAKYVFLLYFIVTLFFGAFWFLLPDYWNTLTGWPPQVASGRIVGMAVLVLAIGSLFAYRSTSWQQVEIFVMMGISFSFLGVVGLLWGILATTPAIPSIGWFLIGINALFGILFLYVYFKGK